MKEYQDLLSFVLENGERREERTGTGTLSVFGYQSRYDLRESFPVVTTKRVFWKAVVGELLWFLEGGTRRDRLEYITFGTVGENATIWDEWASECGDLGPIYGHQWRYWDGGYLNGFKVLHDQVKNVIENIRRYPQSRRHIVSAWNPAQIEYMALPPCHVLFQFYVSNDGRLDCQLYQRSADLFLGVPFNIASYSLLTYMVAHVTGLKPGYFIHTLGDAHIYLNHIDQVREQLSREPKPLPKLRITKGTDDIFSIGMNDIVLEGYEPHPPIKAEVAV